MFRVVDGGGARLQLVVGALQQIRGTGIAVGGEDAVAEQVDSKAILRAIKPVRLQMFEDFVDLFERRFDEEGETTHTPAQPAGSG